MEEYKLSAGQLKYSYFWYFGMTLVFSVCMNYDLRKSYVYWYGSILIYVLSYLLYSRFKLKIVVSPYISWMLIFILLSCCSLNWCISSTTALEVIKDLIMLTIILYFILIYIESKENAISVLASYFIAVFLDTIYLMVNIDISQIGNVMVGQGLIEGWNGNGIGFMTASGVMIGVFLFIAIENRFIKLIVLLISFLLGYITVFTGSRTAFLMLVVGLLLFFLLEKPKRIIRNVLVSAVLLYISFYLIMNTSSLYAIIGIRLEGLFYLLSGKGKADSSALIRSTFIRNGINWFKERPLLGYGINNYKELNTSATGRFTYAHNNFVEIAVDLGIIGLLTYYSFIAFVITKLIKNLRDDLLYIFLLASLLVVLLCHYGSVWYYDMYQNLLLLICSISVSRRFQELMIRPMKEV